MRQDRRHLGQRHRAPRGFALLLGLLVRRNVAKNPDALQLRCRASVACWPADGSRACGCRSPAIAFLASVTAQTSLSNCHPTWLTSDSKSTWLIVGKIAQGVDMRAIQIKQPAPFRIDRDDGVASVPAPARRKAWNRSSAAGPPACDRSLPGYCSARHCARPAHPKVRNFLLQVAIRRFKQRRCGDELREGIRQQLWTVQAVGTSFIHWNHMRTRQHLPISHARRVPNWHRHAQNGE